MKAFESSFVDNLAKASHQKTENLLKGKLNNLQRIEFKTFP